MGRFNQYQGVRDIESVILAIHRSQGPDTKVGCVGYCLGGRLALMTAKRTDISASVGYYGVGIDNLLREAHAIANPVMLHVATADHFVAPEVQKAMHEGLDNHTKVTIHDYSGTDHGFAAEFGKRRDEEGEQIPDKRMAGILERSGERWVRAEGGE